MNRLDHEHFHEGKIDRLLHFDSEDCRNEVKRLKILTNEDKNRNIVKF